MPPKPSRYTWEPKMLRYRDSSTGRFVPRERIFAELNKVIALSDRRILSLAHAFQRGDLSLRAFKAGMRDEVKALHVATAVVANGGVRQMDAGKWGEVGARLRREFSFLNDFASELASGRLARSSGRVRSRARAYVANARISFWQTTIRRLKETGRSFQVRRRMGGVLTEHCRGCRREARRGWVSVDALAPIGSQECRWFCRCYLEIRFVRAA